MCGSSIVTSTSSPSRNGSARSSTSRAAALQRHARSGRSAAPRCPRSGSACRSPPRSPAAAGRGRRAAARRHRGVHLDQERLGVGPLGRELAQLALDLDRHGLLGEHHALAVAGRAGLGQDLAHALGHVLAGHLDQPERRDLHHVGLRAVLVERLAQRLQHGVAVARARHVDEVDDDDPADVAQPQLAHHLLGGLEVGLGDRVLEPRALAAAGERARVDVDHRHRLGVVDHQVAARGQVHPAATASTGSPPRCRSARTAARSSL